MNLIKILVFFFPVLCFGQHDSIVGFNKENRIVKNFDFQFDEFFPAYSKYYHKGSKLSTWDLGHAGKFDLEVCPQIYFNGSLKIVVSYSGGSWAFLDKIDVKIGEDVFRWILSDCSHVVKNGVVVETCFFDISEEYFEKIVSGIDSTTKFRVYGKNNQFNIDVWPASWKESFKLLNLLKNRKNKMD